MSKSSLSFVGDSRKIKPSSPKSKPHLKHSYPPAQLHIHIEVMRSCLQQPGLKQRDAAGLNTKPNPTLHSQAQLKTVPRRTRSLQIACRVQCSHVTLTSLPVTSTFHVKNSLFGLCFGFWFFRFTSIPPSKKKKA